MVQVLDCPYDTGVEQTSVPPAVLLVEIANVCKANLAVAVVAAAGEKVHCGLVDPEHGPAVQLENTAPVSGTAVSVIGVFLANCAVQVAPQLIPAGALETTPVPLPAASLVTVTLISVQNWPGSPTMLLLPSGSPHPLG